MALGQHTLEALAGRIQPARRWYARHRRAVWGTAFVLGIACTMQPSPKSSVEPMRADPEAHAPVTLTAAATEAPDSDEGDAGVPTLIATPAVDGPKFYPFVFNVPVFSAPEWPAHDPSKATEERRGVVRLGYLRWGSSVVYTRTFPSPSCSEGWYELASGGFVCGRFGTTDPEHKELKKAPGPPSFEASLPYKYGLNLTNGTPLYKWRPLRKERAELEKGLQVGRKKKRKLDDDTAASQPAPDTGEGDRAGASAGNDTPWYLQDHHGKRPTVTFDQMKGEGGPLVITRMVRGFYLAIDKEIPSYSGHFFRTTQGYLAPKDHILLHQPKNEFQGVELEGATPSDPNARRLKLPVGFITSPKAHKYEVVQNDGALRAKRHDEAERFAIVQLTGKKEMIDGRGYFETSEGWWLKDWDGTIAHQFPVPKDLAPGEKWIDVDLYTQTIVAYEGDKPVFTTLVSSGRHNDEDKSKDHRTVQGSFRIREKHIASTMADDGATDGPYSIQDVPWIMYFEGSYALHGAFWHSQWGHERSHGCVNLNPTDAKRIFQWTLPAVPVGWHGVRSTSKNPGTRVIVHDSRPGAGDGGTVVQGGAAQGATASDIDRGDDAPAPSPRKSKETRSKGSDRRDATPSRGANGDGEGSGRAPAVAPTAQPRDKGSKKTVRKRAKPTDLEEGEVESR
jgi:hypothetical protein